MTDSNDFEKNPPATTSAEPSEAQQGEHSLTPGAFRGLLKVVSEDIRKEAEVLRTDAPTVASADDELAQKNERAAYLAGSQAAVQRILDSMEGLDGQRTA